MLKLNGLPWSLTLLCGLARTQTLNCDLQGYRAADGLKAEIRGGALQVGWTGESGQQLREFAIRDGQPVVQELAVRKGAGQWVVLGSALQPEFHVTSGKWNTFWDAPLVAPGVVGRGDSYPLPRDPSEVRRSLATFHSNSRKVAKVDRQIIPATDMPSFGSHEFKIRFDAAGKKWVRFTVWDSAGDGAYTQPVLLNQPVPSTQTR